jgi:hypothetical protein
MTQASENQQPQQIVGHEWQGTCFSHSGQYGNCECGKANYVTYSQHQEHLAKVLSGHGEQQAAQPAPLCPHGVEPESDCMRCHPSLLKFNPPLAQPAPEELELACENLLHRHINESNPEVEHAILGRYLAAFIRQREAALRQRIIDLEMELARLRVKPIVDSEIEAENRTKGLHL